MTVIKLSVVFLFAFTACGGASSTTKTPDPVPASAEETPATPAGSAAPAAAPGACYVEKVNDKAGCWPTADQACQEICGAACKCTEASSRNSCSC